MDSSSDLQILSSELKRACEAGLVKYYHLGACTTTNLDFFAIDLYIVVSPSAMHQEDILKNYLRGKYGRILRAIAVESNPW